MAAAASTPSSINLQELLSVCVGLSQHAGESIRRIFDSGNLGAVDKDPDGESGEDRSAAVKAVAAASPPPDAGAVAAPLQTKLNDPQTLADLESQAIIVGNLRRIYGRGLRIVGEEGEMEQCQGRGDQYREVDPKLLDKEEFPEDLKNLKTEDVALWIDPLDGTKEYTQGFVHYVTVLIGVSYRRRALGGVVHIPFVGGGYVQRFDPLNPSHRGDKFAEGLEGEKAGRTVWGAVGVGVRGMVLPAADSIPADRRFITTTRSHFSPPLQSLLERMKPQQVIRCGGAGSKGLLVLGGDADAYLFPSEGTKRWDSCAIDALVRAAGGTFTDQHGEDIDYDPNQSPENTKGLLATRRDHQVYVLPKDEKAVPKGAAAAAAAEEDKKANL